MRSIQSDPRHTDVQIILAGQAPSGRASRGWVSGYCDVNELEVFTMTAGPRDAQALQVFLSVLGGADVE